MQNERQKKKLVKKKKNGSSKNVAIFIIFGGCAALSPSHNPEFVKEFHHFVGFFCVDHEM